MTKRRGRPTSFDRDSALDAAATLFWQYGHEGTSLAMLPAALRCTAPTLYSAFGSKQELYRKALTAYRVNDDLTPGRAPNDLPPYEMVERYLRAATRAFVSDDHLRGCMVAVGSLQCAPGNEQTSVIAAAARAESLNAFVAKMEEAALQGHFAEPIATAIAHFYTAVVRGLAVQAIDGATIDQLDAIIDMALRSWPHRCRWPLNATIVRVQT